MASKVQWAGNPHKQDSLNSDTALTPRRSFKIWEEKNKDYAKEWHQEEIQHADTLMYILCEVALKNSLQNENTKIKRAEKEQRTLISELNHRVRNILNLVNGIIEQSMKNTSIEKYVEVVSGRIMSLSSAHDLLTSTRWSDIRLKSILDIELEAYVLYHSRIHLCGEDVSIRPDATTSLVLTIHELITNCAKHGAFATENEKGTISVKWSVSNEGLTIYWKERIPHRKDKIQTIPEHKTESFGMQLIRTAIPHELDGPTSIDLEEDGLLATIFIEREWLAIHSNGDSPL